MNLMQNVKTQTGYSARARVQRPENKLTSSATTGSQMLIGEGADSDAPALGNNGEPSLASLRVMHLLSELRDETTGQVTAEAMRQEIYELQVHQIELEMQNEELRRTQLELDEARNRYFDLYDLAPVAFCTLSETGLIVEANLRASMLFVVARHALIGKPITRFIHKTAQDNFYMQCNRLRLLKQGTAVNFYLQMQKAGGATFCALLAATVERQPDQSVQFRFAITAD